VRLVQLEPECKFLRWSVEARFVAAVRVLPQRLQLLLIFDLVSDGEGETGGANVFAIGVRVDADVGPGLAGPDEMTLKAPPDGERGYPVNRQQIPYGERPRPRDESAMIDAQDRVLVEGEPVQSVGRGSANVVIAHRMVAVGKRVVAATTEGQIVEPQTEAREGESQRPELVDLAPQPIGRAIQHRGEVSPDNLVDPTVAIAEAGPVVVDDVERRLEPVVARNDGVHSEDVVEEALDVDRAGRLDRIRLESLQLGAVGGPPRTVVVAPQLGGNERSSPGIGIIRAPRIRPSLLDPLVEAMVQGETLAETFEDIGTCSPMGLEAVANIKSVWAMPIASKRYQFVVGGPEMLSHADAGRPR
jgi:hypothetical protein